MRSKAWLAARVSLRLARLRSTRAAAPVLLAHAEVTKTLNIFQWVQNLGTRQYPSMGLHASGTLKLEDETLQSHCYNDNMQHNIPVMRGQCFLRRELTAGRTVQLVIQG